MRRRLHDLTFKQTMAIVLAVAMSANCLSLTVKQKASTIHQTVHAAITKVDDFELELCQPDPAATNHCTAQPRVLTDAQHQQVSALFVKIYALDVRTSKAIIAYKSGDPVPADLKALEAEAVNLIGVVKAFGVSPRIQTMLDYAQAVLKAVTDLVGAFGGQAVLDYAVAMVAPEDLRDTYAAEFLYSDAEPLALPLALTTGAHVYVARGRQWVPLQTALALDATKGVR